MKTLLALCFTFLMAACWESKPRSFSDLETLYREAHAARSQEKLLGLVSKSQAFEDQRSSFEMSFKEDIERPIRSIELIPLGTEQLSYQMNGKTYRPQFPPKGRMKVAFDVGENDITASSYLVGEKDGRWWIVSAEADSPR